jgi:hypothetical protein
MSCILRIFWKQEKPKSDTYVGAGIVFTDGKLILAGYQPLKKKPFISGLGGSKEENDTDYFHTAVRETLEELYDMDSIPDNLIAHIRGIFTKTHICESAGYIFLKMDFTDLKILIGLVKAFGLQSRLYDTMPKTLSELLLNRKIIGDKKTEITHLCLLPLVNHPLHLPFVDLNLMKDIGLLFTDSV